QHARAGVAVPTIASAPHPSNTRPAIIADAGRHRARARALIPACRSFALSSTSLPLCPQQLFAASQVYTVRIRPHFGIAKRGCRWVLSPAINTYYEIRCEHSGGLVAWR